MTLLILKQLELMVLCHLTQASVLLNESRTNLTRKCKNKKVTNYYFCPSFEKPKQKYSFKKAKSCFINNVFYSSLSQASKALNIHHKTVKNRIESNKWPGYKYFITNKQ